jgi:hypothetical protein
MDAKNTFVEHNLTQKNVESNHDILNNKRCLILACFILELKLFRL